MNYNVVKIIIVKFIEWLDLKLLKVIQFQILILAAPPFFCTSCVQFASECLKAIILYSTYFKK